MNTAREINEIAENVLEYWFGNLDIPASEANRFSIWFKKDRKVDDEIRERFGELVFEAGRGDLNSWQDEPRSSLALVILLDQFPRNIFRGDAKSFSFDDKATKICEKAIEKGFDMQLPPVGRVFMYIPYMHSEHLEIQNRGVQLFEKLVRESGPEDNKMFRMNLDFAEKHRNIIERFGRFPHRNEILGRQSSEAELEFLKEPGSSF